MSDFDIDAELAFEAQAASRDGLDFSADEFTERVGTGFNQHGVRENTDEDGDLQSVDVIYEAMQPGPPDRRKGVRITSEFLSKVASKDYSGEPPFMLDHERASFSKIGDIKQAWFSQNREKLMLMNRIPNTGSATHDEAIARFTNDPPSIRNGSLGFNQSYTVERNDDGEPELVDATIQEFSTTPFPGGYDEGGLAAAFSEQVREEVAEFDDEGDDADESSENSATNFTSETITF